jgi:hypothetical protein
MKMRDVDAYFFGCWKDLGHHLWLPGMQSMLLSKTGWVNPRRIDGAYAIRSQHGITRYFGQDDPVPSGWTVLTMHDFTVDTRPGSHATFAVRGLLSTEEALAILRERFPEVLQRLVQTRRV